MLDPTLKLSFLDQGIAQVSIIVPNLEQAVENYWDLFGIGNWHIYTYGKPLVKKMVINGKPTDYKMRLALSYFGHMRIELVEMVEGNPIYADFVKEHGYGVHHFGVLVDDMERALAEAEAAGIKVTMEGEGFGLDGDGHYAYLDTADKIGVTLELINRPKRRMPPDKILFPT